MNIEDDDEADSGEKEFTLSNINKNCRRKGKPTPDGTSGDKHQCLSEISICTKESLQSLTKIKPPNQVPVLKSKPKSKKQKAAEQRRREKEMKIIANEITEKVKSVEICADKTKQAELEKQKHFDEERSRQIAAEKKRSAKEVRDKYLQESKEQIEREETDITEEIWIEKKKYNKKRKSASKEKQCSDSKLRLKEDESSQKTASAAAKQHQKPSSSSHQPPQQLAVTQSQAQSSPRSHTPTRQVPPRFAQKQQPKPQQQKMQTGPKKAPVADKKSSVDWSGHWPGEESSGWAASSTGNARTESDSVPHRHSDSQEFGTWRNPHHSGWGVKPTSNEIIVDTKDKEAWPSIGVDQSQEGSSEKNTGDIIIDNASVKSGSVITSSSIAAGQGQRTLPSSSSSIRVFGSSATHGQCSSSVWGSASAISSTKEIIDSTENNNTNNSNHNHSSNSAAAVWGISLPSSTMNSVGWGSAPVQSQRGGSGNGGNQGQHNMNNMQSNLSGMSDPITSSNNSNNNNPLSSVSSSAGLGWAAMNNAVGMGSGNNGPQNTMQQQAGGGGGMQHAPTPSSGAQLSGDGGGPTSGHMSHPGSSWQQGIMSSSASLQQQQKSNQNQDSRWNSIRGSSAGADLDNKAGSAEMPMDSDNQWGASPGAHNNPGSGWGNPPNPNAAAGVNKQNYSGWGSTPSPNPLASSEWGQQDKSAGGGAWGADNGGVQGAWGATNKAPSSGPPPNSWAQAAGKGLHTPTPAGKPPTPPPSNAPPSREDIIRRVVDSNEGWGKRAVRQDSSWDVDDDDVPQKKEDDNVWNQSNDGTAIWESSKENAGAAAWSSMEMPPPQQQGKSGGGGGGGAQHPGNWQQDDKDSKMWNGPPDNAQSAQWGAPPQQQQTGKDMPGNQWNNPPPSNQWGSPGNQQQNPSNNNMHQWGGSGNSQAPSGNNWGGPSQQVQQGNNGNHGNSWGNQQGGAPPPMMQQQQTSGSGWGNNPASQSSNNGGWGNMQPPQQQGAGWGMPPINKPSGNWGANNPQQGNNWGGQQQQPPAPPGNNHQNSSWDNNASANNWGNPGDKGASGQQSSNWGGHNNGGGNNQNGSWGASGNGVVAGGNKMDSSSWGMPPPTPTGGHAPGGGWGDAGAADVKPMGWDEPSPPTPRRTSSNIDNGTQYWGDPTSQNKPCQNWSSPSTPSTPLTPVTPQPMTGSRQKPDDKSSWGQPPSNKNNGWGEPVPPPTSIDDGTAIWNQQNPPQSKSMGWTQESYSTGAKPKSTSNWGDNSEWNPNTAKKMVDSGWDDGGSVSAFDDTDMGDWDTQVEASSWSSAPGWNKGPKKIIKGASKFGLGGNPHPQMRSKLLQQLMDMGFKREDAQNALISNNMNLDSAISDLVAGANRMRDMEMELSNGHKPGRSMRGSGGMGLNDDISDAGMADAHLAAQMSLQAGSSAFSSTAALLGGVKPAIPSLSSSLAGLSGNTVSNQALQQQQKYMQQPPMGPPGGGAANQQMRGSAGGGQLAAALSVQQQIVQQQIVQQLRMAVQAGLIAPQLLHQELPAQVLMLLQQLLQHQNTLQRLVTQQQVTQQSKTANPLQQRQQLEQIGVMIQRIKQQILQLQQQIQAAHQSLAKTPTSPESAAAAGGAMPGMDALKGLTADFTSLSVAKDMSQPPPLHPQQGSRLTQLWKLPSPEKDLLEAGVGGGAPGGGGGGGASSSDMLNRVVGSKPIQQSHSTPNLQSRNDVPSSLSLGGSSTWSNQVPASSASSDWPTSSAISMPTSQSDSKDSADKESLAASNAAMNAANNSFNLNDMIPEFVPGKPWTGYNSKSVEDDEHITPGSAKLESRLSVSTIKVEDVMTTLGKSSPISSVDTLTSGANTSSWGAAGFPRSSNPAGQHHKSSWGGGHQMAPGEATPTTLSTELWGVPTHNKGGTRPPPGLTNQSKYGKPQLNHSMSWAPGETSAYRQVNSGWGGQPVSSWLILKNLTPQIDGSTLRLLCTQHGPLQTFYLSLNYGQALVRYKTSDEAIKAQKSLNTCVLGNTTILAEFATDSDVERLISQQNAHSSASNHGNSHHGTASVAPVSTGYSRSASHHYGSKGDASHWNGAPMGGFSSSMWGTGGGGGLWSSPMMEDHNLLPGDLLGPTM